LLGDFQYRERHMTARNGVLRCDGLQSVIKLLLNWVPLAHGWKMGGGGGCCKWGRSAHMEKIMKASVSEP
jgi:hypothetical protein